MSSLARTGRRRVVPQRPPVPPVPPSTARPRWSVMIPTYNCARYLETTLRSVLGQDPGPDVMEILVVDDHSTSDDPEEVVRDVAGGRVGFHRQPRNVGHVRNFNDCLHRARGEWVHLLHGDDWVGDGFYATADAALHQRPDLAAFLCRYRHVHDGTGQCADGPLQAAGAGVLSDWLERLAQGQRLQAPSIAVRRRVYERVGGFDLGLSGFGEDWEMWLRVAAEGPVWWDPKPLAYYRVREGSLSDRSRLRRNVADMHRVMQLNRATLASNMPAPRAEELTDTARRAWALALVRRARRELGEGADEPPWETARGALLFWPRPEVAMQVARLLAAWARTRR
jgi:GT2 family glycosyltransferase